MSIKFSAPLLITLALFCCAEAASADPISILPIPNQVTMEGSPFSLNLAPYVSNADSSHQLVFSLSGLSASSFNVNPATGIVSSVSPLSDGVDNLQVQVTDITDNDSALGLLNIFVTEAAIVGPTLPLPPVNADSGMQTVIALQATNPDIAEGLTWLVQQPQNGSVFISGPGMAVYTSSPGYSGPDFFTYTAVDGDNALNSLTELVQVNVQAPQPTPVPEPGSLTLFASGFIAGISTLRRKLAK